MTVSDKLIEIAARAMCRHDVQHDADPERRAITEWAHESGYYLGFARAALEAASLAAVQKPVAWRYRKQYPDGGWTDWLLSSQEPRWHEPDADIEPLYAHPSPAVEADTGLVERFATAILHGDDEHREWLLAAATAFNAGQPLPPPNGKGRSEALEQRVAELERALRVFAQHYEPWMAKYPDETQSSTFSRHTIGDLRRARAALRGTGADQAASTTQELERELDALKVEHAKVLAALPPRILNPVADGGGHWHYELTDAPST